MRTGDGRDIVTVAVSVGGDLVRCRNIGDAECIACLLERSGTAVVGKDTEVADALHAGGKDMQEEAVDELLGGERGGAAAGLGLSRQFRLSASHADLRAVEGENVVVADGNSMCVTRDICEDLLGAPERRLGVDHPVLSAGGGDGDVESCRAGKMGDAAGGLDLSLVMGLGQFFEEAASEQAGEDLDRCQEGCASGGPGPGDGVDAGIGDEHEKMRVQAEFLIPCMVFFPFAEWMVQIKDRCPLLQVTSVPIDIAKREAAT